MGRKDAQERTGPLLASAVLMKADHGLPYARRAGSLTPVRSILAMLPVGFKVADGYGMSWDDQRNYLVGVDALQAYTSLGQFLDYLDAGDPLAHHGPAYFMLWAGTSKVWDEVVPWWKRADARHFTNFLMYVVSVVGVYALSVRLMGRRCAWMTAVLFAMQPLLRQALAARTPVLLGNAFERIA